VQFTIPAALWQQVRLIRGSKFGTFSLETRVSRCNFVACRLDPSGGWVKNYMDSRCLASSASSSITGPDIQVDAKLDNKIRKKFLECKTFNLNPNTKIIFTARTDNLLHLHSTIITIHRFQSICFKCNFISPSFYWKLAISFRIVHRRVHELAALQLQITDTLCDCDGNIMIFGLVLCYTRWMQACTCLLRNWERGLLLPSQIQRCTTVVELSNVLSSDVHL
jgi:hypothetical protein